VKLLGKTQASPSLHGEHLYEICLLNDTDQFKILYKDYNDKSAIYKPSCDNKMEKEVLSRSWEERL
jgi:hypothetical protein